MIEFGEAKTAIELPSGWTKTDVQRAKCHSRRLQAVCLTLRDRAHKQSEDLADLEACGMLKDDLPEPGFDILVWHNLLHMGDEY